VLIRSGCGGKTTFTIATIAVGACSFGMYFLGADAFGRYHLVLFVVSQVFGGCASYYVYRRWVFSKVASKREADTMMFYFLLLFAATFVVNILLLHIAVDDWGMPKRLSQAIIGIGILIASYRPSRRIFHTENPVASC
jgi:putative flippase GtrA